jgi:hypothetical protein
MRGAIALGLTFALVDGAAAAPVPKRDEPKEQQQAVEVILKLGGSVMYDYQRVKTGRNGRLSFDPKAEPENPSAFHRVVHVSLRETKVTDDDLRVLNLLPKLAGLDLSKTSITGAGLKHLKGLKELESLSLWNTRVDDDSLEHIKGLIKMGSLVLDGTRVTDTGLIHLKDMTDLEEWLGLSGTKVTDAGLVHLEKFTKLRSLTLSKTQVTAAGVKVLRAALSKTDISFGP